MCGKPVTSLPCPGIDFAIPMACPFTGASTTLMCFHISLSYIFSERSYSLQVIAKGEAQGMVSKSIGIMLGIALANSIGSSTSLALASFSVVTWIHMFCNLKSYQSIQLRTLNPYRASNFFLFTLSLSLTLFKCFI